MRDPSVLPSKKRRGADQYSRSDKGNCAKQDSLRKQIEIRMTQGLFLFPCCEWWVGSANKVIDFSYFQHITDHRFWRGVERQ
jgi:hypothetical protein